MSANTPNKRISVPLIKTHKGPDKAPLVCLTAYSTPVAKLVDPHCDIVLVGDSVGMVVHGLSSTLGVTMEMMILHGQAARRGTSNALLVVDMPFGSYEQSPQQAFANASRLMQETDCAAVKLEGGKAMAETIAFLTARGIPVMGHVGLTPQAVNSFGGYKVQGRGETGQAVRADARAVAEAGAFSVVLEMVPDELARTITENIDIPTIGIGASPACDGQILVVDDMLGMFSDFTPKFVKRYAELAQSAEAAIAQYAKEVRARQFPEEAHVFGDEPAKAPDAAKPDAAKGV